MFDNHKLSLFSVGTLTRCLLNKLGHQCLNLIHVSNSDLLKVILRTWDFEALEKL